MTHTFHHPKYYKELRKRNKSDQVISSKSSTEQLQRAPGSGHKLQASSYKLSQSSKPEEEPQASSSKLQASSPKHKASSVKPQATSSMIREPRNI